MSLDERHADTNLNALENALAGLRPQPSRTNRDRLLFEAGREAEQGRMRRAGRVWSISTGLAAAAAASFGILLLEARTQLAELQVALSQRPVPATVAFGNSLKQQIPERPPSRSEIPSVSRQASVGQNASGSPDTEIAVGRSGIVVQTPTGGPGHYLALRNRALLLGIDAVADAAVGQGDRQAAGANDAVPTNRDLRHGSIDRSERQPDEFELFRRGRPVIDGEIL
jgi:hypothetical protein